MSLLIGIVSSALVCGNLVLACLPLFAMAIIKGVLAVAGFDRATSWMSRKMDLVIDYWVGSNRLIFRLLGIYRDETIWENDTHLDRSRWYVAVCNHQSWPDILILQTILDRVPPIKFFTKRQLLWIPFFGLAMWLLGFPYVRRLSREQIAANPKLLGVDRESTLQACEGFRNHPTTILNFLEGTRYTTEKHANQEGRFSRLLNPKSGGLSLVLAALEQEIDCLIDVTIDYPNGTPTFWQFMKGECRSVEVHALCREIPAAVHAAEGLEAKRQAVEAWVEDIWGQKDLRLLNRRRADSM
jgi:1-acyl-sn-glycerol-3-phosphate acyltransferase